eukprot:COSAG02_NODE_11091_length_1794_cov_2.717404_2_plen_59_part_00
MPASREREPHRGRNPNEPMPTATMALTDEEEYNWDVAGYLLIPAGPSIKLVINAISSI